VLAYPGAVDAWLERSALRAAEGSFRWYTMAELAAFLSERERVAWSARRDGAGGLELHAEHPATLARQSWTLPAAGDVAPVVVEGQAQIVRDGDRWLVQAGDCTRLVVTTGRAPAVAQVPGKFRIGRRTP
jgi:hypothetical protein